MTTEPQSEHDWTIHSLNIHGIFFERWCQQVISSQPAWNLTTTNYPVAVGEHRSSLDIRADLLVGKRRLMLLIECKKNNPEFVDWVFFLKQGGLAKAMFVPHIETAGDGPAVETSLKVIVLRQPTVMFVNDARETRGNYQSYGQRSAKTKTSNSAITEAANQIALAIQAVHTEQLEWARNLLTQRSPQDPSMRILHPNTNIIPLIVTSANLFVCEFNANDVDGDSGELPFNKATLVPVPSVVYEYPLPYHLQTFHLPDTEAFVRRHIIVVHSSRFADFLENQASGFLP